MCVYTLTFGEVAEHSYTSRKYSTGQVAVEGLSFKFLKSISEQFSNSEFYDLSKFIPPLFEKDDLIAAETSKACLLILRNGIDTLSHFSHDSQFPKGILNLEKIQSEIQSVKYSTFVVRNGIKKKIKQDTQLF